MSEQEQPEIELLRQRQERLEREMTAMLGRLRQLEEALTPKTVEPPKASLALSPAVTTPVPAPAQPAAPVRPRIHIEVPAPTLAAPPVIGPSTLASKTPEVASTAQFPAQAAAVTKAPDLQPKEVAAAQTAVPVPPPHPLHLAATPERRPAPPVPMARPAAAAPVPEEKSFEMRLGTYWLVRIGVVMVLTGLVFFGNLAYHKFISQLGPAGKVALLYLASFGLLGAGAWCQRKQAQVTLKNYAQVLFAGGLAAVYFTTYAAHHLEQLRVITSPFVDGVLLLAWAGVMAWVADRRKSEVLAVFAVGLAYYTSVITRVGYFTLYSNFVLAMTALFFLVRNRWAALSLASLVATYAGYGFWRFFDGQAWHWASPEQGLWTGTWFLVCYWVVFTAATFLSRSEKIIGENRAAYATLNNGAFFAMFLLTMLQVRQGGFWKFLMVYGTVLLGMAALATRVLRSEPLARNSYLTQGLLLVTVGLITKFTGLQLALLLAAESVILLIFGQRRQNAILLVGALISGGLSVGWGMDGLRQFDQRGLLLGAGLGALMLVNTFLAHRHQADREELIRPRPAYFAVLTLAIWWVVTYDNCTRSQLPVVLAVEALVFTLSIYVLRLREFSIIAQFYLLIAVAAWFLNFTATGEAPGFWNQALLVGITLGLSHWWQRQKALPNGTDLAKTLQGLYAVAIVGVVYLWLSHEFSGPGWMALTALLAVGITVYGVITRSWFLAGFSQFFIAAGVVLYVIHVFAGKPEWGLPVVPVAALVFLAYGSREWLKQHPDVDASARESVLQLANVYRWAALGMSIMWICQYVPVQHRIWVLALIGLWFFLVAGLRRKLETTVSSAVFTITGLVLLWSYLLQRTGVHWPNLFLVLALLGEQRIARRVPDRYNLESAVHTAMILAVGFTLWFYVSIWVMQSASGFYLTASWSVLALVLFSLGIVLRERMYRWVGLGVLACSIGRVIVFDVWKLETLYRILSFMALGIVLLVLGFIYNKYQEKIREWL